MMGTGRNKTTTNESKNEENEMATNAQWMQRRLASRALQILPRHQDKSLAIAAYLNSLGLSAPAFIAAYDAVMTFETTRSTKLAKGYTAIRALLQFLRAWTAVAQAHLEGFDRSQYGDKPAVPDDVISDAEHFVKTIERHVAEAEEPLWFTEALMSELVPAIEAAKAEWVEAGAGRAEHSELLAAVRETGDAFQRDLVSFRQTLRAIIGRGHPDYQKLRAPNARTADADDDEIAASLPESGPTSIDADTDEEDGDEVAA